MRFILRKIGRYSALIGVLSTLFFYRLSNPFNWQQNIHTKNIVQHKVQDDQMLVSSTAKNLPIKNAQEEGIQEEKIIKEPRENSEVAQTKTKAEIKTVQRDEIQKEIKEQNHQLFLDSQNGKEQKVSQQEQEINAQKIDEDCKELKKLGAQFKPKPAFIDPKRPDCAYEKAIDLIYVTKGVRLSQGATVTCKLAKAFQSWVVDLVQPTLKANGFSKLEELKVAAHYYCRNRNHLENAKISEHAKANAIDISALHLADGQNIIVASAELYKNFELDETTQQAYLKLISTIHSNSCSYYTTILGPGDDVFHKDHFHFDVIKRRNDYVYCPISKR